MSSQINDEVRKAYEDLASAIGVTIDYANTEKFLRKFLGECAKVVLQERDVNLTKLKCRLTALEKTCNDIESIGDKIKNMKRDAITEAQMEVCKIERQLKEKTAELEEKKAQVANVENNPFLLEINALVTSLKANDIPDKEISEIVTTYITSLGYIRYKGTAYGEEQATNKAKKSKNGEFPFDCKSMAR